MIKQKEAKMKKTYFWKFWNDIFWKYTNKKKRENEINATILIGTTIFHMKLLDKHFEEKNTQNKRKQ